MSNLVFPSLPGVALAQSRAPTYSTTVHTSASGLEQRAAWQAQSRIKFGLTFNGLLSNIAAPSPYGSYTQTSVVEYFQDQHLGAWDSFYITDPRQVELGAIDPRVRVRFVEDSLEYERIWPGAWAIKRCQFISVLPGGLSAPSPPSPFTPPAYTTATLPPASALMAGSMVYVKDSGSPGQWMGCRDNGTGTYEWIVLAF